MVSSASQRKILTLDGLSEGQCGVIVGFDLPQDMLLKLMEMGMGKGRKVRFIRKAPLGDPLEVEILQYRLAIRCSEARGVRIRRVPDGGPVGEALRRKRGLRARRARA